MTQHEYRQFTEASVEAALRVVERRESEGWEFASMFPKSHGLGAPGREFEVVVVIRRPASASSQPPKPTE
jgi:hypothetical protein